MQQLYGGQVLLYGTCPLFSLFGHPNGKEVYMTKRKKQLLCIMLCVTLALTSSMSSYQKASASGLGLAVPAVTGLTGGTGLLVLMGIVGLSALFLPTGQEMQNDIESGNIEKFQEDLNATGEQIKDDFYNYTTKAIENNQSAAQAEIQTSERIHSVIDDFLTTLQNGVVDVTSEAWDWFREFVNTLSDSQSVEVNDVCCGYPYLKNGTIHLGKHISAATDKYDGDIFLDVGGVVSSDDYLIGPFVGLKYNDPSYGVAFEYFAINKNMEIVRNVKAVNESSVKFVKTDGSVTELTTSSCNSSSCVVTWTRGKYFEPSIPLLSDCNPSEMIRSGSIGATDIPGVSNPAGYVPTGNDLPWLNVGEGTWDLCDPLGFGRDVTLGKDIPFGCDSWEEVIEKVVSGEKTWEEVAEAVDCFIVTADGFAIGSEEERVRVSDYEVAFPLSMAGALDLALDAAWDASRDNDQKDEGSKTEVTYDENAAPYVLDFKDLFPFCIPFDIYHFIKVLKATPVAPVIHYKFQLDKKHVYTIDLNLNKFNEVAAILRRMELLLYICGLAFVTRSMIIRG